MPDVPEQLRNWARSLGDSVEPTDIERITSPMTTPTGASHTRRWLAAAASFIVVVAGIVVVAVLARDDGGSTVPATNPTEVADTVTSPTTEPTTEPSATTEAGTEPTATTEPATTDAEAVPESTSPPTDAPTTVPPTTVPDDRLASWPEPPTEPIPADEIPFLLPSQDVAFAGTPVRARTEGGSAAAPTFTQVFADADSDILLTIETQPGGIDSTPDDLRRPTTIDGWDDAFFTEGSLRLVVSDPSGLVRLVGSGLDDERAAEIVASMRRRPAGVPGWDLAADFADLVEINGAWNDSAGQRSVTWFDGDAVVAQMLTSPAHTYLITQALSPSFERVDVNGAPGWSSSNGGRRSIVWSPDGDTIVVLGVADERIDPVAVARSVSELDAEEYDARTTDQIPSGVGDGCDASLFC